MNRPRVKPFALLLSAAITLVPLPVRSDEASADDLKAAASWCATAARVGRGWLEESLPDRYVRRALKTGADELDRLDRSIAKRGDAGHLAVAESATAVRRVGEAVERNDIASLPGRLTDLQRRSRALAAAR